MRFMIIRKADAQTEAEDMPTEQLLADMGAYMEELARAGVLLGGDGLKPSRTGVRINFKDGTPSVVDGPFAETKELVAGYTLLQCGSMEEAVEWMKKWPRLDGGGNVSLEIRPLYEADDFGEAFTPELREQEDRLRNELAAKAAK